jgi:ADP-ribose pyrophosphatase
MPLHLPTRQIQWRRRHGPSTAAPFQFLAFYPYLCQFRQACRNPHDQQCPIDTGLSTACKEASFMRAKTHRSVTIHEGRVFRLTAETVTLANGVTVKLEIIRHPGAAAIVAIEDNRDLLMLRQYRHAVGGAIWEIPAGTLTPGETPLHCAQRELAEEAGVRAAHWKHLGAITPLPGYSDERIHLYLASGLTPTPPQTDPDEILEVHPLPLEKALSMMATGEITDAKTMAGLCLAREHLSTGGNAAAKPAAIL